MVATTPQRQAYSLRTVLAFTLSRLLTQRLTRFGSALRRYYDNTPVIAPATVGFVDRPATITALGQVAHQITHVLAVGKFAVSRHGKHIGPALLFNELQRRVGGKPRIP